MISRCRKKLYSASSRKKFWEGNKKNFERNIKRIIRELKFPKKWKVYIATGSFLTDKRLLPFDYDVWSGTFLSSATKRQGFEILMFLNRRWAEFLSIPALIPLVVHEAEHAKHAAKHPRESLKSYFDDTLAKKDEKTAELAVRKLPKEFQDEAALESILYCYDIGGWKVAKKMADYLWKEQAEIYSGGYDPGMTKAQYNLFLRSKKTRDIKSLIKKF